MKKKWIGILALLVVAFFVVRTLYRAGSFKSLTNHVEGTVTRIYRNVPGPEDYDVDQEKGILFISSTDRWKVQKGIPTDDGIWKLAIDATGDPVKFKTTFAGEFHPHGISYLKEDSVAWLFAVNHNSAGNFVEIFKVDDDTLFHVRSVADPMMCCPNDVVAVDRNTFYVTNDHGQPSGILRTAEEYLQIPWSYLLYYDGAYFSKAWTGINYGNGVNISRDGKKLYLATTTGRTLFTFSRDANTGKLDPIHELNLNTGIDNINIDVDGNLWIGAHPKMLAFVDHAKDSSKVSPSQVLKLIPDGNGGFGVQEIYLNDGTQLSGSSVALHYKDELWVGGVFERKILRVKVSQ